MNSSGDLDTETEDRRHERVEWRYIPCTPNPFNARTTYLKFTLLSKVTYALAVLTANKGLWRVPCLTLLYPSIIRLL